MKYTRKHSSFLASEATSVDDAYFEALASNRDLGATRGIDAVLRQYQLDALVLPARGKATRPAGEEIRVTKH